MADRVSKAEEQLDTASGETLSIEDMEDIYMDAKADERARENMARNARLFTNKFPSRRHI